MSGDVQGGIPKNSLLPVANSTAGMGMKDRKPAKVPQPHTAVLGETRADVVRMLATGGV